MVGKPTVVFPGFDGGAEWGGSAVDPETGVLYVNANDIAWTGALARTETAPAAAGRSICSSARAAIATTAPERRPQIPSLVGMASRRTRAQHRDVIQRGAGRMPGFPALSPEAVEGLVEFLQRRGPRRAAACCTASRRAISPDRDAVPLHRLPEISRSGRLSGRRAAVGHAERDRSEHRRLRVADSAGRVSGAGGEGHEEHRHRELRRSDRHRRRAGVHRARRTSIGSSARSTRRPARCCGRRRCRSRATPRRRRIEVDGRQFVVIAAGGGKGRRDEPSGGTYVAFALPRPSER